MVYAMTETETVESSQFDQLERELTKVVRRQLWIVVTVGLALSLLLVLLFMDHSGWVIVAIILLVSVKKAFVQFKVLGKRKDELVQQLKTM